jgi:hypothetical protein
VFLDAVVAVTYFEASRVKKFDDPREAKYTGGCSQGLLKLSFTSFLEWF